MHKTITMVSKEITFTAFIVISVAIAGVQTKYVSQLKPSTAPNTNNSSNKQPHFKRSSEWGLLNDLDKAARKIIEEKDGLVKMVETACVLNCDCLDHTFDNYCCQFQCCNMVKYIFRDKYKYTHFNSFQYF